MTSNLVPALNGLKLRSARGLTARSRIASPGLNRWLERNLTAVPGQEGSLLAEPLIEAARSWETHEGTMADLRDGPLSPDLVDALDQAGDARIPADRHPYTHQVAAWDESLSENRSVLVTAGTGAGKTECFLIPILQDLLANPRAGHGVRAILLYPLNALIESQRERLRAWAEQLGCRVRFALYNGDTKHTEAQLPDGVRSDFELLSRELIRNTPPEILVTNTTMLEYMMLRHADMPILQQSQGALRWIVLDEAHSYVGSQAAEMALLLRRVRSAFGVTPDEVRLMATSATIGGEGALEELRGFTAALAGQDPSRVSVIEGRERTVQMPPAGPDAEITSDLWVGRDPDAAGSVLAAHPRLQEVRRMMQSAPTRISDISEALFLEKGRWDESISVIEAAATARLEGRPLLPWRAHLFHRAQGGVWACPDPNCEHRAEELADERSLWPFGSAYLNPRSHCECGAPVYEVVSCGECGTPHLQGDIKGGVQLRLVPPQVGEGDDYALDLEVPYDEETDGEEVAGYGWLKPAGGTGHAVHLDRTGLIFENGAPEEGPSWAVRYIRSEKERGCCDLARKARLGGVYFGPAFFMGNGLPGLIEDLPTEMDEDDRNGEFLPAKGRRALTFSDSRQGVARLSAKLHQESERSMTRSFLWHRAQAALPAPPDPAILGPVAEQLAIAQAQNNQVLVDILQRQLNEMNPKTPPVTWGSLVNDLAGRTDMLELLPEAWLGDYTREEMQAEPLIGRTFLFRELFKRPRVQNNAETMGLLRLTFPALEAQALGMDVPAPLMEAGFDREAWKSLVLVAIDYMFREQFAVDVPQTIVSNVNPLFPFMKSIANSGHPAPAPAGRDIVRWPAPSPTNNGIMQKLPKLIYRIIGGSHENPVQRDHCQQVLDVIWGLITSANGAAVDHGGGRFRLNLAGRAAVIPLERAWLCPVSRRVYGYSLNGWSPNDYARPMTPIEMPRLPFVSYLTQLGPERREEVRDWLETDDRVDEMRRMGVWTNLHDRLALIPPYMRSQEHSAQIHRPLLKGYEDLFRRGRINLLNCTTTMEMGVDLANVSLVVNANVPPSLSNYRQRAGRAGRRGEPWAFTTTFCRNLPIDKRTFKDPTGFLARPISAPRVWMQSAALVQKHVNVTLLAAWMRENNDGMNVIDKIGPFMGAIGLYPFPQGQINLNHLFVAENLADQLLADLESDHWVARFDPEIRSLIFMTALEGVPTRALTDRAREAMGTLVQGWRLEFRTLIEQANNLAGPSRKAVLYRARHMGNDFLLSELSRRMFSPSYGFPTDVISFYNRAQEDQEDRTDESYFKRGGASRPMSQAIREYAPGADVMINGRVHRSEGVLTAWEANMDPKNVEDFRSLWDCGACGAFGLSQVTHQACPDCGAAIHKKTALRPAGFVSNKKPHTGYESLNSPTADPDRASAHGGDWVSLPEGAGRTRSDPAGRVLSKSSGPNGAGFAICLSCGRGEPEHASPNGVTSPLPDRMDRHSPLNPRARLPGAANHCQGGVNHNLIMRQVHLAQMSLTDVWEWQLPSGVAKEEALGLAAALREALAELLGVEPDEIAPTTGTGRDAAGQATVSVLLHDRAAGGAGLSTRLGDTSVLVRALQRAARVLACDASCIGGCPSCILRSDLNVRTTRIDRVGAQGLATRLLRTISLEDGLQVLGPETRLAGRSAERLLLERARSGTLRELDIWLHGSPDRWDLDPTSWPLRRALPRLRAADVQVRLHLPQRLVVDATMSLPRRLALHACAQDATLHLTETAPLVGNAQLLMRMTGPDRTEAFVVTNPSEAVPGETWGVGSAGPALVGPAPDLMVGTAVSPDQLIEISVGNARSVRAGSELDGEATMFGDRFWSWVRGQAPLIYATLTSVGVSRISYSDRYLQSPYVLLLLSSVLGAVPGGREAARMVRTANSSSRFYPTFAHDPFEEGDQIKGVLEALVPGVDVTLANKIHLPHERSLELKLRDGRQVVIYLDQGFGAWRTAGSLRHDFKASAAIQARQLSSSNLQVQVASDKGNPVTILMS